MKTHGHQPCSICVLTHAQKYVAIEYSVNMLSAIVHQMRRSQFLPGYPHSSAGAYASAWSFNTELLMY